MFYQILAQKVLARLEHLVRLVFLVHLALLVDRVFLEGLQVLHMQLKN